MPEEQVTLLLTFYNSDQTQFPVLRICTYYVAMHCDLIINSLSLFLKHIHFCLISS